MNAQIEQTLTSLRLRHINGIFAENSDKARQIVLSLIPMDAIVGIGDSTTIRQVGILQVLKERGINVLDAFDPNLPKMNLGGFHEYRANILIQATVSNVFLTGTNALTQDGRLVNVDSSGNRVAGMFWGHPISVVVIGRNKIVKDLDEAFHRIRNVIAPNHIRIRSAELGGEERNTPCVVTGECSDCRAADRVCNIFTIIEGKPRRTDLNVVIVDEDLGLGWDNTWPQDRIMKILENYKKFVCVPPRIKHEALH
jgi:hypothetical protein